MSTIQVGDVVQVDPSQGMFGACFVVVSEVKSWGIQGYASIPGNDKGRAYIRLAFDKVVRIGVAEWVAGSLAEDLP